MNNINYNEFFSGLITILITVFLIIFISIDFDENSSKNLDSLVLGAEFGRVDGVILGSSVRISGIDVGFVNSLDLLDGNRTFVNMVFKDYVPIPIDSAAVIETDSFFGKKHIEIYPGGEEDLLLSGSRVSFSQDSIILEDLLIQIIEQGSNK